MAAWFTFAFLAMCRVRAPSTERRANSSMAASAMMLRVSWEFSATSKFMSLYSSPFKIIDVNQMVKPNECQAFFRKNLDIEKKIARFKFLKNENCPMV